jgi:L-threonylcarbamoyladenylate synthase
MVQNLNVEPILEILKNGGLILFPTDTVWGIGCDAANEAAVCRLQHLKQPNNPQPLVLLVDSVSMLRRYVPYIHPRVDTLVMYHARPLTMIYESAVNLPANLKAPDGSVAIRIVRDEFCQELIRQFGKPIVGTAACLAGHPIPTHFGEISSAILQGVDHVVRYRQLDKNMEPVSVIARLNGDEELEFLRE